jgi:multidrug efflux pump subunit AcrA (membrane-fusion protein)
VAEPAATAKAWSDLTAAGSTAEFYASWLTLLTTGLTGASASLLLLADAAGTFLPAAVWPARVHDVSSLVGAAEAAIRQGAPVVQRPEDAARPEARLRLAQPLLLDGRVAGVVVVELPQQTDAARVAAQITWSFGWLEAMYRRQTMPGVPAEDPARRIVDILAEADAHDRFDATAIRFAAAVARRFGARRVSIGLAGRRGIQLAALSHSIAFDKRSTLVRGLEAAMQEAFDQLAAVAHPPVSATERRIAVGHASFADAWDVASLLSVVLVAAGRPVGVLTIEWSRASMPASEDVSNLIGLARAAGSLLDLRHRQEAWLGGRLLRTWQRGIALIGPGGRPTAQLALVAAVAAAALLACWPTAHRVSARAVVEGAVQRAAAAPFDGFIARAAKRAGDAVKAGEELAALDDRDLQLERLKWEMEEQKLIQRQREAAAKHDRATAAVLGAQIEQARSQLELAQDRLARTRILAPIDGVVVAGDLSQSLGAPVGQGKVLFEIAPLDAWRLVLQVDERDAHRIATRQPGQLLLTGSTRHALAIAVTRPPAVATVEAGRTVFRVEAAFAEADVAVRPGMEGVAKIAVGQSTWLAAWTRPVLDRMRLFVWTWSP